MSNDASLRVLVPSREIHAAVQRLAGQLRSDYLGKNPLLIGVLKGCFVFLADLVRQLNFPLEMEFIRLCSYGANTETSGRITLEHGPKQPIEGRHVLLVEDIVDTGLTTSFALRHLSQGRPASLRLCSLADKPSRHRVSVQIDYLGFTVPDRFVVGYGLDLNEGYRYLPDICYLEQQA